MHSSIIEIRDHRTDKGEWATECNFYDDCGDIIEYCRDLTEDERAGYIEDFMESELFNALFTKGDEADTIVYNGKLDAIKSEWYKSIQVELDKMVAKGSISPYYLNRAIEKPFLSDFLFCLPDWNGDRANYPRELMEWLDTLKDGDVLYICGVVDYHF